MTITGIEQLTFGVQDLALCQRFFTDLGLSKISNGSQAGVRFETLNGATVRLVELTDPSLPPAIEEGSTLREVVWGVASEQDLEHYRSRLSHERGFYSDDSGVGCLDPIGVALRVERTRKRKLDLKGSPNNVWGHTPRIDEPSPIYDRAQPIEIGHVVFFTNKLSEQEAFYTEKLGFAVSDRYPNHGTFLRCAPIGGHHNMFLFHHPAEKIGLNHVAFTVRDLNEVFGGGMHINRCGWETTLGPGRHPISSAFFWYIKNPAGALAEYYTNEDHLTANWKPRDFKPGPTVYAEWAIEGGIDGNTRRQKNVSAPDGRFMTERKWDK